MDAAPGASTAHRRGPLTVLLALLVIAAIVALMVLAGALMTSTSVPEDIAPAAVPTIIHDDAGNLQPAAVPAAVHDDGGNMQSGAAPAPIHDDAGNVR